MNRKTVGLALLIATAALGTSCGAHRGAESTFHDPNMDFGLIRSVAVLPFQNLSNVQNADETARDVFMTVLQARVDVYVIPPGEILRAISRMQPENPVLPTAEEAIKLAENLEADVVVTGAVLEYGQVRSGSASSNVCSMSVKMLEGQTGRVVWSASTTRGGVSAGDRLVGSGGQPMNRIVTKAAEDLVERLFQ